MGYKILHTVVFIWWLFVVWRAYAGLKDPRFSHYTTVNKIGCYIFGPLFFVIPVYVIGLVLIWIWS